jgi:hypothetical protein
MPIDVKPLVDWIVERRSMQLRRERGEPPPWTSDPFLAKYRFCNVRVEDDYVSRWIHDNFVVPHADDPHLIFALIVARFINEPEVLAEVGYDCLVPFDGPRFVSIMAGRDARGESLERRAYIIPGGRKGELKAKSLTKELFNNLYAQIEFVQPRQGNRLVDIFDRLTCFKYLKAGFISAQAIRDVKYAEPLRSAPDWMSFVRSGPGSRRGVNRLLGATDDAAIHRKRPEKEGMRFSARSSPRRSPRSPTAASSVSICNRGKIAVVS